MLESKVIEGPLHKLATRYFEQYGVTIQQVWYEPKMDIYYCRTIPGDFWQIPTQDLRDEARLLKWEV